MVAGALTMAVAGGLLFLPPSVGALVAARLLLGAGEGFVFTAASAWIVDLAPVERRGQSIGLFGLSIWGGLSAGPVIGEALYAAGGYDAVWALAVAGPVAGAWLARRLPDAALPERDDAATAGRRLIPRETVRPGLALALANIGYATLAAFVGLHLAARGEGHGAAVFTAYAAAVVATRLLAGRVPDRFGARVAAIVAGSAEAAGLAIIAVAGTWWVAAAGAVVMGSGFALLYPALALVVVDSVPEARRGAALGAFTAFFDAGVGLGGPLAGGVAALGGYPAAFWAATAAALGTVVIAARVTPSRA
jgi:MFS family permease